MAGPRSLLPWPSGTRRGAGPNPALSLDAALPAGGIHVEGSLLAPRFSRRPRGRCVLAIGPQGVALSTAGGLIVHPWSEALAVSGLAAYSMSSLTLTGDGGRLSFGTRSRSTLAAALAQVPPDVAGRRLFRVLPPHRLLTAARVLIAVESLLWLIPGFALLLTAQSEAELGFPIMILAVAACGLASAWWCPKRPALTFMLLLSCLGLLEGALMCAGGGSLSILVGLVSLASGVFVIWVVGFRGWRLQGRVTVRGCLDAARVSAIATFGWSAVMALLFLLHERPPTPGHAVAGTATGVLALLGAVALVWAPKALGAAGAIRLFLALQVVAIPAPVIAFALQRVPDAWAGAVTSGLVVLIPALVTARLAWRARELATGPAREPEVQVIRV